MSKLQIFLQVFRNMNGRVKYLLGAKADPNKDSSDHSITRIDCSGYVRFSLVKMGFNNVPDGSLNHLSLCEAKGLHRLKKY